MVPRADECDVLTPGSSTASRRVTPDRKKTPLMQTGWKPALSRLAALALTLAAAAGCVPIPESNPPVASSTETRQIQRENLALRGKGDASVEMPYVGKAIDGDPETAWTSQHMAPHWFSVTLDSFYPVDKIELVVTQHVPGPTSHDVWLENDSGNKVLHKRFDDVHTEDNQVLEIAIEPPQHINQVYVLTRQGQGWVAWREIRVLKADDTNDWRPAETDIDSWQVEEAATGLELPVQITHAGDGSGRLFVVERGGRIRIVEEGRVRNKPFLDISDRVRCCQAEEGLFNIAFPPEYPQHRQFYLSYTNLEGNTVISRMTTTADPDRADPDSEEALLVIPQPAGIHNGGSMIFGPNDGYLYIGSRDGGLAEHRPNAQDPGSLLGKLLRIDVEAGAKPYAIPADNPFIQADGYRPEIWALGIRNSWGFAFDGQTGDLYIPDAGDDLRDEVNYQPASSVGGENYGWPVWQGNYCVESPGLSCGSVEPVFPVAAYDHSQGCVVVGGAVYRDIFLYADFCRGHIWGLQSNGEGWTVTRLIDGFTPISGIGADEAGNLYAAGYAAGVIYLLTPPSLQKAE